MTTTGMPRVGFFSRDTRFFFDLLVTSAAEIRTSTSLLSKPVTALGGGSFDTTASSVLITATHFAMPISSPHAITTSIIGGGCARRWSALNFHVFPRILVA